MIVKINNKIFLYNKNGGNPLNDKMATKVKTQDELVQELFDKVQSKKIEVEKAEKSQWVTSGQFRYSSESVHNVQHIAVITDVRKITEMLAFLIDRENNVNEAAKRLDLKPTEFRWLGFTTEEWENDFKIRISQINRKDKLKELNDLQARLDTLVSPELKAKMELEAISAALNA